MATITHIFDQVYGVNTLWKRCEKEGCNNWTLREWCLRCELDLKDNPVRYLPEMFYGRSGLTPAHGCKALLEMLPAQMRKKMEAAQKKRDKVRAQKIKALKGSLRVYTKAV